MKNRMKRGGKEVEYEKLDLEKDRAGSVSGGKWRGKGQRRARVK